MIAGLFLYAAARDGRRSTTSSARAARREAHARRRAPRCSRRSRTQAWDGEWYRRAYDAAGRARRLAGVRGRQDLHREPGLVRARRRRGGRRAHGRAARARGPGERARAPLHAQGHRAPAAGLLDLPPRARRGLELPARGQGERRHLLPQQHLDPPRLVPARRGRPRPRVLPLHLPVRQAGARSTPTAPSPTSTRR